MIKIDFIIIVVSAGISAIVFTVIFLWLYEKIDFCLWWRRQKRFIDKQYDDASKEID